jgi:hypothetical protein
VRFAAEYHGGCRACDTHVAFAFGFSEEHEPRAIAWEGPRCVEIAIRRLEWRQPIGDSPSVSLQYLCRSCGEWNEIQTDCRPEPVGEPYPP